MRKLIFCVTLIILIYVCIESFSYGGLFLLKKYRHINYEPVDDIISNEHRRIITDLLKGKTNYIGFSSTLGWTIKANGASELYQANSSGIRSNKDYELNPPANLLRIATFGDSFTHCDNVPNDATWQTILESLSVKLEVLNFGVGGYGLDQAYLRYLEEGIQYKPHLVIIGYISSDIFRHVNTFRPFNLPETGLPLTKPRFVVEDEALSLIPNPMLTLDAYTKLLLQPKKILPEIGISDFYYSKRNKVSMLDFSPTFRILKLAMNNISSSFGESIIVGGNYNKSSEAFKITKKIFDEFYKSAIKNNSIPVIVIFPDENDIIRYRNHKTKNYFPLTFYFDSMNYQYIDLMNLFERSGNSYEDKKSFVKGHYSPFTNALVAKYIHSYLLKNGFLRQ